MSTKISINANGGNPHDNTATVIVRPPSTTAGRPPTSLMFSRGNIVSGRLGGDKNAQARPSTAVRAVGYAASSGSAGQRFDEAFVERAKQKTLSSANAAVEATKEVNPQIQYKNLEAKIVNLLESSIVLSAKSQQQNIVDTMRGNLNNDSKTVLAEALSKAKEAFSLDRTLHRFQDQHGENVFHNFELTYAVFFNLAEQYENNGMYVEALNTYNIMTRNKMFPNVNQLKLNMGNIYYKMSIYPKAIKMYRMALDSVPNNLKQLRLRITKNIGILFVRMGQYADAVSSFEFIMSEQADIRSGVHLILCYYAMGDVDKIKNTFRSLCDVQPMETENDLDNEDNFIKLQQHAVIEQNQEQHQRAQSAAMSELNVMGNENVIGVGSAQGESIMCNVKTGASNTDSDKNSYVFQALKYDELAIYTKQRKNNEKRSITMMADLISPIIEENYNDGYNWCIEVIKTSNLSWLANELELNKALVYLRQNDVNQAIETLHMYDRKSEGSMTANALTNLVFIYINATNDTGTKELDTAEDLENTTQNFKPQSLENDLYENKSKDKSIQRRKRTRHADSETTKICIWLQNKSSLNKMEFCFRPIRVDAVNSIAETETKCHLELHQIQKKAEQIKTELLQMQLETERKKAMNADIENKILMQKLNFIKSKNMEF